MKRSEKAPTGGSRRRWVWVGGLFVAALVLVVVLPYLLSAYHLQVGGQSLEETLGRHDAIEWWYVGPRAVRDEQGLSAAITHLEKARRAPYAQRRLGQAYVAQGRTLDGVHALEQFVAGRPRHYLAQLELAAAYVYADARLPDLQYLDLLAHLEGTQVSAPDLVEPTPYAAEGWANEFVYPTTYSLPPEYGDRPTLFCHAGSQVTWTVALTQPSVLRFGMGQAPQSLGWGGDGATFEVLVNGERLFLEHLPPDLAREGWQEREVDLAPYVGQTIRLSLATTPGPAGDVTGDWAGWGEPRLEDAQALAYQQTVKNQPWRAKWSELGITAADWFAAGEIARQDGQYERALTWYQWGERLSPDKGDVWVYRARLYEDQERWTEALDAYRRALDAGHLALSESSVHCAIGMIYQRRLEAPQPDAAAKAFQAALDADDFETAAEAADCTYRLADTLRGLDGLSPKVLALLETATELDDTHAWAHVQLGLALYKLEGDAEAAFAELLHARTLSPQDKWIHYHLAELYRQERQYDQARQSYQRALEIDPGFKEAREKLQALPVDK
jgi:tetratricopeptide (TPR) repeat protein